MKEEKVFLNCPSDGADELRYTVYRSVFSQVNMNLELNLIFNHMLVIFLFFFFFL